MRCPESKAVAQAIERERNFSRLPRGFGDGRRTSTEGPGRPTFTLSQGRTDRKRRKRDFRRLWITRINAAARSCGMSYSSFMNGIKKAGIVINRKMLSDLANNDMAAFTQLAAQSKSALGK